MLLEFKFSNYRSFREEASLDMEATGLGSLKSCLIPYKSHKYLPAVSIFGKNGGGKSNIIRAFWIAVQFICNAQRTQYESSPIPVRPFLLDDGSADIPTAFEFIYTLDDIKYQYGFSATRSEIVSEYLYFSPNGQKALVFDRDRQKFTFRENAQKKKRELISEAVAKNQLYFAVACTMNEAACVSAMRWFRGHVFFSRDYSDIPQQLIANSEAPRMLHVINQYAQMADVGIKDMKFEVKSTDFNVTDTLPNDLPENIKAALSEFMHTLADSSDSSESKLKMGEISATSYHNGLDSAGNETLYPLGLEDESDGTRTLMALAPCVDRVLKCGGIMLVDEIEKGLHPLLVDLIVSKFQSPATNPHHAQLVFTTHDLELLNLELIRKDQIYFVDKDRQNGASSLYSISEFSTPTAENVRKGYLLGKYGAAPDLPIEEVD